MTPRKQPGRLRWTDYYQSVRRIAARHNPAHGNYRMHGHDFFEIVAITGGICVHRSALGNQSVRRGDVFVIRPGACHAYTQARGLSLYNCCFDATLGARELGWMADDPSLGRLLWRGTASPTEPGIRLIQPSPTDFRQCLKLLHELEELAAHDYLSHHGDHLALLLRILSILARSLSPASRNRPSALHRAVTEALGHIEKNPTGDWTLTSLASRVHVEPTYFVRLFRAAVGLPPMAFLARRRLELAANLLLKGQLNVGEVGAMSGWTDANYFTRCFHQHYGMTPTRYRSRFRRC